MGERDRDEDEVEMQADKEAVMWNSLASREVDDCHLSLSPAPFSFLFSPLLLQWSMEGVR